MQHFQNNSSNNRQCYWSWQISRTGGSHVIKYPGVKKLRKLDGEREKSFERIVTDHFNQIFSHCSIENYCVKFRF